MERTMNENKLFESRHLQEFLGLTKSQIFHWSQSKRLIEPAELGTGRGGRSRFSFENILEFALAKGLFEFGFELGAIYSILKGAPAAFVKEPGRDKLGLTFDRKAPWIIFKSDRNKYENEGLWLEIFREDEQLVSRYTTGQRKELVAISFRPDKKKKLLPPFKIEIDLVSLISQLEEKTGCKL